MTLVELNKAIAAQKLPALIYLYGEEAFLLEECLKTLVAAVVDDAMRDFNYLVVSGKELDPVSLIDVANTYPVFASKRMIVIRQAQNISVEKLETLQPYINNPAAECCLVFCADKIDKRKKFFQLFKKQGELIEFKPLYPDKIPAFIRERVRLMKKQFSEDGLQLFCRRVGSNLSEIISELNKLGSYCGDETLIDVCHVATVVSDTRVENVFDLTDAIGGKNLPAAFASLERLQADGEAPLKILAMVTRHFRQLWKTRSLLDQHTTAQEIARIVRINPYFVERVVSQARKFRGENYAQAFELFVKLDLALKSSGGHPPALMQQLVTDLERLA